MTDHSIPIGGGTFHYLDWGNPTNHDCILMVHGFNQSCHSWDEFCPRVSHKYRVIAIDQRGHGESYHPQDGDYSTEVMVNDIYHITNKLGIAPFVLIGMSMGARNSALFAKTYPNLVKSLVLVDWSPQPDSVGLSKIEGMLKLEWNTFSEAVDTVLAFNLTRTRETIEQRLKYTLGQLPSGKWTWRVDRPVWLNHFQKRDDVTDFTQKQWDTLQSIKPPTLLIRGKNSDILSDETALRMSKMIPNCQFEVVDKAGHSVAGDNPEGFYQAVMKFLNEQGVSKL